MYNSVNGTDKIGRKEFCDYMGICSDCDKKCSTCKNNEDVKKSYYEPIEPVVTSTYEWRIYPYYPYYPYYQYDSTVNPPQIWYWKPMC